MISPIAAINELRRNRCSTFKSFRSILHLDSPTIINRMDDSNAQDGDLFERKNGALFLRRLFH